MINEMMIFSLITVFLIIAFGILPRLLIFILKGVCKIYEKFFLGDNVVKISNHNGKKYDSQTIGRKIIVRDANGNIIDEKIEGINEDFFRQIMEQAKNSEFNGNMSENAWPSPESSARATLKTFSGELPEALKKGFEKYGAIKVIKDQYGNTIVEDGNGNILEGNAKKEALEASRQRERFFSGSRAKEIKMNNEEIEEFLNKNGSSINNSLDIEKIEEIMKNSSDFNIASDSRIKEEFRVDMNSKDVVQYNTDEDDDIGIKRY